MSIYERLSPDAMYHYIRETPDILSQLVSRRQYVIQPLMTALQNRRINRVIIIGSGTSFHAGLAVRKFFEEQVKIPCDADYPILFKHWTHVIDEKTLVIGLSQGGESKSTIVGLDHARQSGALTVAITSDGDSSPVAKQADVSIKLECGEEHAGPKTKGYQASMMTLFLIALSMGEAYQTVSKAKVENIIFRMTLTINRLSALIDESVAWYQRNRSKLLQAKRLIVVGTDSNYANVLEGRLKIEEAVRYGIEGYELEEFMHGIYHSINADVQLIYLATKGNYQSRILRLRDFMADYSGGQYVFGDLQRSSEVDLSYPFVDDEDFSVFEYIIPLQIVAFFLSKDLGINANIPKIINFHKLMGSK